MASDHAYVTNKSLGIKRPASDFALFMQSQKKKKIQGKSSSNAVVRASQLWSAMTVNEKKPWRERFQAIVARTQETRQRLLKPAEDEIPDLAPAAEQPVDQLQKAPRDLLWNGHRLRAVRFVDAGAYGTVYAMSDGWQEYAAKVCSNDSRDVLEEVRRLGNLAHPHVMTIYAHMTSSLPEVAAVLVMPLGECSLLKICREAPGERRVWVLLHQIALALIFIHSRDVLHADVKPGNIIISGSNALLSDFGLSLTTPFRTEGQCAYTSAYRPPECWLALRLKVLLTTSADVFAFGCVCFEAFTGQHLVTQTSHVQEMFSRQVGRSQVEKWFNNMLQQRLQSVRFQGHAACRGSQLVQATTAFCRAKRASLYDMNSLFAEAAA
ncbi:MAPK12 [Symbiodinium sp. CCMP2592]|nr:MAPK12 [Symbiodinium sp. CCMP2592]